MKKIIALPVLILVILSLSACHTNPRKPRLSAGGSHSIPFTIGEDTPGWLTNAVRIYPWSKGNKVRISTGVGVKPTRHTNAGFGIDW